MSDTNSFGHVTPEQIQSQINAWTAVAIIAGGVLWHLVLKAMPVGKAVAPWAKANGGLIRGVFYFFWTPKPKATDNSPTTKTNT